jgi:pimeloyl-ACP methyl ester carboxylesterase
VRPTKAWNHQGFHFAVTHVLGLFCNASAKYAQGVEPPRPQGSANFESVASITKPFPPAPLGREVRADAEGFLTVTPKGIAEDFAQDLPDMEKRTLMATQGPTAAAVFGATITTAAWKTKPSWCVIASNDRAVPPELEKAEAAAMKATSITVPSSHVPMLSHPKEVADSIVQAAAKAGSQ